MKSRLSIFYYCVDLLPTWIASSISLDPGFIAFSDAYRIVVLKWPEVERGSTFTSLMDTI